MQLQPTLKIRDHREAGRAWLGIFIPLLLIAGAAGAYLLITNTEQEEPTPPSPQTLEAGKDFYLMVRTIELYPTRPGGVAWDRIDGSGPDIQFSLTWQGNVVFESQKRSDTLIASWDALALDVKSAVLQGKVDLAGSIDAAIIHVQDDSEVTLQVWDSDLAGSDSAGAAIMKLDQFTLGDNTFTFEPTETNAIKRVVVRVIDKALPVSELVQEATRP